MTRSSAPTRIVASVAVATRTEAAAARAAIKAAGDASDVVELRGDGWRETSEQFVEAVKSMERPVIATVRARAEGGLFDGSEDERRQLLAAAGRAATWVDVEASSAFVADSFAPARTIVSRHDLASVPADLAAELQALRAAAPEAAYVKLAVTPNSLTEAGRVASFARHAAGGTPPLALVAMGDFGRPLRALAGKLGSAFAYGNVPGHAATAPGQWTIAELAKSLGVREQEPATPVLAVVGNPIAQSLSPLLHNTLLRAAGLPHVFVPMLAERLDAALALAEVLDLQGLSVTLPFKVDALHAATGAAPGFEWPPPEGSVNTLLARRATCLAANTDRLGFLAALATHAPPASWNGRNALVLGAGGVARTSVAVLRELGANVTIASRSDERARALAEELGATAVTTDSITHGGTRPFQLIVNATPVGMHPDVTASPLADGALHRGQVVFDLIYRPRRTRLLLQAARAGAVAIGGFEMFLAQALAQFRLFTGAEPDGALARATLERALES